jgi:hypothetical protein
MSAVALNFVDIEENRGACSRNFTGISAAGTEKTQRELPLSAPEAIEAAALELLTAHGPRRPDLTEEFVRQLRRPKHRNFAKLLTLYGNKVCDGAISVGFLVFAVADGAWTFVTQLDAHSVPAGDVSQSQLQLGLSSSGAISATVQIPSLSNLQVFIERESAFQLVVIPFAITHGNDSHALAIVLDTDLRKNCGSVYLCDPNGKTRLEGTDILEAMGVGVDALMTTIVSFWGAETDIDLGYVARSNAEAKCVNRSGALPLAHKGGACVVATMMITATYARARRTSASTPLTLNDVNEWFADKSDAELSQWLADFTAVMGWRLAGGSHTSSPFPA